MSFPTPFPSLNFEMTVVRKFVVFGSSRNASAALHSRWIKFQQNICIKLFSSTKLKGPLMHFWNKITKMDWDNLPDIRCSWLADSQQETLLTVGRSCLLMVVWCHFFAQLRLRFSACFVRDNCQCHVENKEEWKVNCQNRNCRKLFCFFWVFLSMFWENWVMSLVDSTPWKSWLNVIISFSRCKTTLSFFDRPFN